jgi:broad specificity phosphatase PhoE
VTTFYIVRHGETAYNKNGRYQGQMDVPLNAEGRLQSQAAAARLAQIPLDVIYASDLSRAQETARMVAGRRTVLLDPRLREINVGRIQGLSVPEIAEREPAFWALLQQDPEGAVFPGGENARQVQERAVAAVEAISARYPEGRVGLVSHGGVIKCIAAAVIGLPLSARSRIVIDNCSLTIVEWNGAQRRLRSLNDTGHLAQAPSEVKADF